MRNWLACPVLILMTAVATGARPEKQGQIANNKGTANRSEARSILAAAKAAALDIKDELQQGLALEQIGAAEAELGDLAAAVDTANRAYPHGTSALEAVGEQLADLGDATRALEIASKIKGDGASTVRASMAARQAETGHIDEALRAAQTIQSPEVRRDALESIARQQAKNGDDPGARKTLTLARAADPAARSDPDEMEVLVAEGQVSRGDTHGGRLTIDSLKSAATRSAALISGADEISKTGDKTAAAAWLGDALRGIPPGPGGELLRYLAIPVQVRLGQKNDAMRSAGALAARQRVKGYAAVAVTCAEANDIECMNAALGKMDSSASSTRGDGASAIFEAKLMTLDVTAALIDNAAFEQASRLLASVETSLDDVSKMSIGPQLQLQRVFILAQRGGFEEALSLALTMRAGILSDGQRGTALRTIAQLQTRKVGPAPAHTWSAALPDSEDRAYSLLGITDSLLDMNPAKLPYSAIQVH